MYEVSAGGVIVRGFDLMGPTESEELLRLTTGLVRFARISGTQSHVAFAVPYSVLLATIVA